MSCPYREKKEKGKGCKHFRSGICYHDTSQFYRCYEWIASTKLEKIKMSHSQMTSWERCPFKWYLEQIEGLETKPQLRNIRMRMGAELQRLISNVGEPEFFSERETYHADLVNIMYEVIKEKELLPENARWEIPLDNNGMTGFVDLDFDRATSFGEIKFGTSPDFYLNNPIAKNQLERYFYMNPSYERAYMMPIRNPLLRERIDEDMDGRLERVRRDVRRRMNHYFPHYEPMRGGPKWGRCYRRNEFDLKAFERRLNWTKREIQTACKSNYFVQKTANCFSPGECSFISIYETGNINWEIFTRRERPPCQ